MTMSILLSRKHDLNAQWLSTVARYVENCSLRFLLNDLKRGRHRGVRNQDDMGTSDAAGSNFGNSSIFGGHQGRCFNFIFAVQYEDQLRDIPYFGFSGKVSLK